VTIFLIILACVVWYAIGFWGCAWNLKRLIAFDFESSDWIFSALLGVGGVVTFLLSWIILRPEKEPTRVVFKQREKQGSA